MICGDCVVLKGVVLEVLGLWGIYFFFRDYEILIVKNKKYLCSGYCVLGFVFSILY